jgi:hypothetical protein
MEMFGQFHIPATLPSGKEPPLSIHYREGWVGSIASLDVVANKKISTSVADSTLVVQSIL